MHAIRRTALLTALVALVAISAACVATDPRLEDGSVPLTPAATRTDAVIVVSGTDATLAADESVDLFVVYDGTARIEGKASSVVVVNGTATFVGARSDGVIAIQSDVSVDPGSIVAGDIRTLGSTVTGATASTVTGHVRDLGLDVLLGWRDLGLVLALIYIAFVVSALMAGVVLAGVAGRQVRAAGGLITKEPVSVVVAAFVGLLALVTAGALALVTVVGIPFGIALLMVVLPGLFVLGYIVTGIWIGERILGPSSAVRDRPYLAAVIGLSLVGVASIIPMVGGLISFVGFGAVMLLSWRVLRRGDDAVPSAVAAVGVADAAS